MSHIADQYADATAQDGKNNERFIRDFCDLLISEVKRDEIDRIIILKQLVTLHGQFPLPSAEKDYGKKIGDNNIKNLKALNEKTAELMKAILSDENASPDLKIEMLDMIGKRALETEFWTQGQEAVGLVRDLISPENEGSPDIRLKAFWLLVQPFRENPFHTYIDLSLEGFGCNPANDPDEQARKEMAEKLFPWISWDNYTHFHPNVSKNLFEAIVNCDYDDVRDMLLDRIIDETREEGMDKINEIIDRNFPDVKAAYEAMREYGRNGPKQSQLIEAQRAFKVEDYRKDALICT